MRNQNQVETEEITQLTHGQNQNRPRTSAVARNSLDFQSSKAKVTLLKHSTSYNSSLMNSTPRLPLIKRESNVL